LSGGEGFAEFCPIVGSGSGACSDVVDRSGALQLSDLFASPGQLKTAGQFNSLIRACSAKGDIKEGLEVFEHMKVACWCCPAGLPRF
jgi:pentatricopeptide repeat protein